MKTNKGSTLDDRIFNRQPDTETKPNPFQDTVTKLGQKIANQLEDLDDRWAKLSTYSEPKIWEKKDRYGHIYFQVFDPIGDRYLHFNSEDEVKWWLDRRYSL